MSIGLVAWSLSTFSGTRNPEIQPYLLNQFVFLVLGVAIVNRFGLSKLTQFLEFV